MYKIDNNKNLLFKKKIATLTPHSRPPYPALFLIALITSNLLHTLFVMLLSVSPATTPLCLNIRSMMAGVFVLFSEVYLASRVVPSK